MQADAEKAAVWNWLKTFSRVEELAEQIIGMQLITPQTSAEEKEKVHKVLIAEIVYYPGESETSEFYMSVLLQPWQRPQHDYVFYRGRNESRK